MTAKNILNVLDQYQKARNSFTQTVNDLATRPKNADFLVKGNVIELLIPLLSDPVPSIQNNAAMALGKLASHSELIASSIIQHGVISNLLNCIDKKSSYYKKSAMFCLKNVAKHNSELAEIIVHSGGLQAIMYCLESFDSSIKESAACTVAHIACHNADLARAVDKAGITPLLVLCLQEPENCLKLAACLALCETTKHSIDLAQSVVDSHANSALIKLAATNNIKIKAQAYKTLGHISKHSKELAESVVGAEVLPQALLDMAHPQQEVKRSAANLIRDISKHNVQFAHLIVNTGGVAGLIELLSENDVRTVLPAVVTLGYIAAHSDKFSLALIASDLVPKLAKILLEADEDHLLSATAWTLGHLGRHSAEHASHLAKADVFTKLFELIIHDESSEDLKGKCRSTLKYTLQKCTDLAALEPLMESAPPDILKFILGQFSKILPNDPKARRIFAATGSLRKIQLIEAEPGSSLMEHITTINSCYPEEIIRYYTPSYPDKLLEQLDSYMPQIPTMMSGVGLPKRSHDDATDITVTPIEDSDCEC